MVRRINIHDQEKAETLGKDLSRLCQSGNINFLFGSGASVPAIPLAGNIENEIRDLLEAGDDDAALARMRDFLWSVQEPTNLLIQQNTNDQINAAVSEYEKCLGA